MPLNCVVIHNTFIHLLIFIVTLNVFFGLPKLVINEYDTQKRGVQSISSKGDLKIFLPEWHQDECGAKSLMCLAHHDNLMCQQVAAEDVLEMAQLLDAEWESGELIIEEEQANRAQVAAHSQMELQAMERVEAQGKKVRRLSALLVEHQVISSPERPYQESPQASPPRDLGQFICEVVDILPGTVNTVTGAGTGQVPDLGRPPTLRRDTFEDILTEAGVPTTPQRLVWFADVALARAFKQWPENIED